MRPGAGLFAEWQPSYAECGISTFPVCGKRPSVKGYLKLDVPASRELASRYGNADAFGFALKRSKIVVVDIDSPDERILCEALDHYGQTPILVRSGSGNYHAWYRRRDEGRRIRPDRSRPIDILGDGYVLAPPSTGGRNPYQMIQGTLDDVARLPFLQEVPGISKAAGATIGRGSRNKTLFHDCMEQGRYCDDLDAMLDVAHTVNAGFVPPLDVAEVLKTARSAWGYTERGDNWFGRRSVVSSHEEIDALLYSHPDAYILLTILRRHNWGRGSFYVANEMAGYMPGGGWARKKLAGARTRLAELEKIFLVRRGSKSGSPALYSFRRPLGDRATRQ